MLGDSTATVAIIVAIQGALVAVVLAVGKVLVDMRRDTAVTRAAVTNGVTKEDQVGHAPLAEHVEFQTVAAVDLGKRVDDVEAGLSVLTGTLETVATKVTTNTDMLAKVASKIGA